MKNKVVMKVVLVFAMVLCLSGLNSAAIITWSAEDFTDASQIISSGSLAAYNLGIETDVIVNGVTFVGQADGVLDDTYFKYSGDGAYGSANYRSWYYAGGDIAGLDDPSNELLGSFVQDSTFFDPDPATMTIKNLSVGESYLIQILVVWNTAEMAPMLFDDVLEVSYTGWGATAQLVTGSFVADDSYQTFTAGYSGDSYDFSNLNAVNIVLIPEPATITLMAMGGIGILRFKKRKYFQ